MQRKVDIDNRKGHIIIEIVTNVAQSKSYFGQKAQFTLDLGARLANIRKG